MSKQRTILILGGGVMQLPAIRSARRLGLRVIVADGNASAPGRAEADAFEHIDLRDREAMLEAARSYHHAGGLHAVFTAGTDFSTTVAFVSDGLGLPGTSLESAQNATDKFRMRTLLEKAGVRVPRFAVIAEDDLTELGLSGAVASVGLPAVVKPADSMGARGVVRVENAGEALAEARLSVLHSQTRRVVLEGFIDGPEFSIDALVYNGNTQITGFADRHIRFPPYFIEMGHTIPTNLDAKSKRLIIAEFKRGVEALGLTNGAAKGDMKLSRDGPVVGEIAARLSGGYMSGWTFPLSSGVELTEKAIRISLGEAPGSLEPPWNRTSAERAVISIPGTIERISGGEKVDGGSDIAELFLIAGPGDEMRLPTSNVEKCGNVIAIGDTRELATHAAEAAVSRLEVVLKPHTEATTRFLFSEGGGYWAYPLEQFSREWLRRIRVDEQPRAAESAVIGI
ncbi:MAG: ATP-grasp domain-containing protein [Spirochaetaceae bacterium]|nr:ATP-grasp domain-containing protein [Spirochaetaceae bacterium]